MGCCIVIAWSYGLSCVGCWNGVVVDVGCWNGVVDVVDVVLDAQPRPDSPTQPDVLETNLGPFWHR